MFTREYPPEVYGGAGVHVTELTRFMRDIVDVDVHCMGAPRDAEGVYVHGVDPALEDANGAIKTLSTGLRMADAGAAVDLRRVFAGEHSDFHDRRAYLRARFPAGTQNSH